MAAVYLHRRADTGEAFYVGKGSVSRARVTQGRNPHWWYVVQKAGGFYVHFVTEGDDEFCLLAEMETIDYLRRLGFHLTNVTAGGEGMTGYKWQADALERRAAKQRGVPRPAASDMFKGVPKSAEHRAKLSAAAKGRRASEEAKRKMSETRRGKPSGMLGKKHSEETKAKISASLSLRSKNGSR